jgi:hypothetical protein
MSSFRGLRHRFSRREGTYFFRDSATKQAYMQKHSNPTALSNIKLSVKEDVLSLGVEVGDILYRFQSVDERNEYLLRGGNRCTLMQLVEPVEEPVEPVEPVEEPVEPVEPVEEPVEPVEPVEEPVERTTIGLKRPRHYGMGKGGKGGKGGKIIRQQFRQQWLDSRHFAWKRSSLARFAALRPRVARRRRTPPGH